MRVSSIFFTGFPGFLGSELLPRVVLRTDHDALCLVQPKFRAVAEERAAQLVRTHPALANRIHVVEGDLTQPLDHVEANDVREIYHLAAVYDLSVARDVGMRVNVEGTRNVLRFAEDCPHLRRHHYVSTCYVSGRHCGPFHETDLDIGQSFNNYYEETKFLAEVEVAEARDGGMPTSVYRPAIVVGDSRTGDTQKFDGPYFLLQWLVRQPRNWAIVPLVGDPTMVRFNMVPSDFVIDAIEHLSGLDGSIGRTYQLADPRPLTVDELLTEMLRATGRRGIRVPLPRRLTAWALANIGPLERYVGIPASAVEYFAHPTHYGTANTERDLAGSGVTCPAVPDYLPTLVRFMTEHREANVGVMV